MVALMCSSVCAEETNPVSKADGAKFTPRSSIRWKNTLKASASHFPASAKLTISLAVVKNKQANISLMKDAGALGLDYIGGKFLLFRRDHPNFPVLGSLLAYPACWNEEMSSALVDEQTKAVSLLSSEPMMLSFIQFVMDYTNADDKTAFLNSLKEISNWSAPMLRFAGYQALIQNESLIAYELFAGIKDKVFGDYLGGALAKARLGEWEASEHMLDVATRILKSWFWELRIRQRSQHIRACSTGWTPNKSTANRS